MAELLFEPHFEVTQSQIEVSEREESQTRGKSQARERVTATALVTLSAPQQPDGASSLRASSR